MMSSNKPVKKYVLVKRVFALLMSAFMVIALFPAATLAAESGSQAPVVFELASKLPESSSEGSLTPTPSSTGDLTEATPTPVPTDAEGKGLPGGERSGLMLMGAEMSGAEECALTIRFSGVTITSGTVRDAANNSVASIGSASNEVVVSVPKGSNYRVSLRQINSTQTVATGVDCTGDTALVDGIVNTLSVNFPGVTISDAKVRDSGNNVIAQQSGSFDNALTFTVLRGSNYRAELRQGNSTQTTTGIDCTGSTATLDNLVCSLSVDFPGVTVSDARVRDSANNLIRQKTETLDGSVAFTVLRGSNYRVELRQGNTVQTTAGIDCTGATASLGNLVCALTADFPGVTVSDARVRDSANNLIQEKAEILIGAAAFTVLRGGNYRLELRQGNSVQTTRGIDCTGEAATVQNLVCLLTLNFPGVTVSDARVRDSANNMILQKTETWTDTVAFTVLRGVDYRTELRQGNSVQTKTLINCSGAVQTVDNLSGKLVIHFPGITASSVTIRDSANNWVIEQKPATDSATFFVLSGSNYSATLVVNGSSYRFSPINVGDGAVVSIDKSKLTVNYPGVGQINSIEVFKNGTRVASSGWTSETSSFNLDPGQYDIRLAKGAMVYEFKNVFVLGQITLNTPVLQLDVNFPGVTAVNSIALSQDGKPVTTNAWKDNATSFAVFDNGKDYSVTLVKGGMSYTGTPARKSGPDRLELNVPILDLAVNFPGVAAVNSIALSQDGKAVATNTWKDDTTSFAVFDNGGDYSVKVDKGGMSYTGTAERMSGPDRLELNVPILDLAVNFPGVNAVNSIAISQDGKSVATNTWKDNTTSFRVFDNGIDYSVTTSKGGMSYTGIATRESEPDRLELNIPVLDLVVNFPGVTTVQSIALSQSGKSVATNTWKDYTTTFRVFDNGVDYSVTAAKGGMSYTGAPVRESDPDRLVLNIPVTHLTVKYPGVKNLTPATISQNGASVTTNTWTNDATAFYVFQSETPYQIALTSGGKTYNYASVSCNTAELVLDKAGLMLNTGGLTPDVVQLSQSGVVKYTFYYVAPGTKLSVLNGYYDILLKRGGMQTQLSHVLCLGDPMTLDIGVKTLTVNYPGVTSVDTVTVSQGGVSVARRDWTNESTSFVVFDNGLDYEVSVRKGGMVYAGSVTCANPVLDVPVVDLTANYPGATSVDTVTVSQNGAQVWRRDWTSNGTSFKVFDNGGSYDVSVAKGGMSYAGTAEFKSGPNRYTFDVPMITLAVNYPGVTSVDTVTISQNGRLVWRRDWTSETTSFSVFDNGTDYAVAIRKGGMSYSGSVSCEEPVLNVPILDLTVNYPGVTSVDTVTVSQNESLVWRRDWTSNTTGFKVFDNGGTYQITARKSTMSYSGTAERRTGPDQLVLDIPITNLKVQYPGITSVSTARVLYNGASVERHDWTSNSTEFFVFQLGTPYQLSLTYNGTDYRYESVLADADVVTINQSSVMLDTGGVTLSQVEFKQGSAVKYTFYNVASGQQLTVLNGKYDIVAYKGAMKTQLNGVICLGDETNAAIATKSLTVSFPGITASVVQVRQDGKTVFEQYNQQDAAQFTVFDNGLPYEAYAAKGAMSATGTGYAGDTIELGVKTVTVNFTGITASAVQIRQSGSTVFEQYNLKDTAQFNVFDNGLPYEAYAAKGAMSATGTGYAGDTIDLGVKTVTVNFTGITANAVQIRQGGSTVFEQYNQTDTAQFNVFDNGVLYEAYAAKGAMSATGTGYAGDTIELGVKTVTVNFSGITANVVQIRQGGSTVFEQYNQTDTAQFNVFDNGLPYEAYAAKGAMSETGTGYAGDTIDLGVKTVTVSFAGITANIVRIRQGGSTVFEQYNQAGSAQFVVFDNGLAYEAYAQKGGMNITQSGTGDLIVLPTMLLRINFPGVTASNVKLSQNSQGVYESYNLVNFAQFLVFDNGLPYEAVVTYPGGVRTYQLTKLNPTAAFPVVRQDAVDEEEPVDNAEEPAAGEQRTTQTLQGSIPGSALNPGETIADDTIPLAGAQQPKNVANENQSGISPLWLLLLLLPAGAVGWLVLRQRRQPR